MIRIIFTRHAEERIAARNISRESVERVLEKPFWTEPDPADPTLTRAYGASDAAGGELLRVVFRVMESGEFLVVTAHLDRTAARKRQSR